MRSDEACALTAAAACGCLLCEIGVSGCNRRRGDGLQGASADRILKPSVGCAANGDNAAASLCCSESGHPNERRLGSVRRREQALARLNRLNRTRHGRRSIIGGRSAAQALRCPIPSRDLGRHRPCMPRALLRRRPSATASRRIDTAVGCGPRVAADRSPAALALGPIVQQHARLGLHAQLLLGRGAERLSTGVSVLAMRRWSGRRAGAQISRQPPRHTAGLGARLLGTAGLSNPLSVHIHLLYILLHLLLRQCPKHRTSFCPHLVLLALLHSSIPFIISVVLSIRFAFAVKIPLCIPLLPQR